jgi:hypothetical protein
VAAAVAAVAAAVAPAVVTKSAMFLPNNKWLTLSV